MDFATLPPEINSGLMYSSPGAGSMIRAAAAWDRLAARLSTTAADYRAVTAKLAAADDAAPYIDWLDASAAQAHQASTRVAAAAGAHRSAREAMVAPPAITANRARRRSLANGNCLAQASPAIADTDADYERMWARTPAPCTPTRPPRPRRRPYRCSLRRRVTPVRAPGPCGRRRTSYRPAVG